MGLTKRQSDAIQQMIIEESRAAYASQQERHRILGDVEGEDVIVESLGGPELPTAVRHAIVDLIEAFYHNNLVYEGVEFDDGKAVKRATEYLYHLIEADVKETVDMLQGGDFEDGMDQGYGMDQHGGVLDDDDLPPMHPRASGKPGGVTGGTGKVTVGGPGPASAPRPERPRGYVGGHEDVDLPPMHPRGRK